MEIIRNYTRNAVRQSAANRLVGPSEIPSGRSIARWSCWARPRDVQGKVLHSWHCLKQPHVAKHAPSPAATSKAITHAQQNSSSTSGALYIGAFVGMPRSAASKGVVARVKANRTADPTAVIRRSMAQDRK